jgi:dTDP-4-amino-4,6-dideoxygalactose transaminase
LSITKEIPPTAGWPVKIKDLLIALFKKHPRGMLEDDFKEYLGSPSALLTYSGTAAFYIILETLKKLSRKKTVVIPAFVCPLIPLAIKRSGLEIKVCDTNRDNFDFNIDELEKICAGGKDILAVLPVHLAGIPSDMDAVRKATGENGIFIIEDCAQSMGAEYRGRKTGTLGDFSFFSLCRGKGLTIYEGGMAITNREEYAVTLEHTAKEIAHPDFLSEQLKIAELFAYAIFYRPSLFWFAFRLPQIFWNMRNNPVRAMGDYFEAGFPVHRVSAFRECAGHNEFRKLNGELDSQRQKTEFYLERIKDMPWVNPVTEPAQCKSNYPYLSLIFDKPEQRDRALGIFKGSGLGISQIYLMAITDYPYLKGVVPESDCPGARRIARQTITLSTSSFLRGSQQKEIINRIRKTGETAW